MLATKPTLTPARKAKYEFDLLRFNSKETPTQIKWLMAQRPSPKAA